VLLNDLAFKQYDRNPILVHLRLTPGMANSTIRYGMMLQSPTTSAYPGKYVMFAFAAFFAVLTWRSSRFAIRARKEQRDRAELGIVLKPDPKKSFGNGAMVAIGAFCLLVTALAAIYAEWPK
jgi:hypothetical protein